MAYSDTEIRYLFQMETMPELKWVNLQLLEAANSVERGSWYYKQKRIEDEKQLLAAQAQWRATAERIKRERAGKVIDLGPKAMTMTRKEILALLATLPPECEGCSAPLDGDVCAYCGCEAKPAIPDEPPDIRKTNASDDPCQMCGLVHSKDAYAPLKCRCLYCGQIDVIAMATYDPILGNGVVCQACCRGAAPRNLGQMAAEAEARKTGGMPWET